MRIVPQEHVAAGVVADGVRQQIVGIRMVGKLPPSEGAASALGHRALQQQGGSIQQQALQPATCLSLLHDEHAVEHAKEQPLVSASAEKRPRDQGGGGRSAPGIALAVVRVANRNRDIELRWSLHCLDALHISIPPACQHCGVLLAEYCPLVVLRQDSVIPAAIDVSPHRCGGEAEVRVAVRRQHLVDVCEGLHRQSGVRQEHELVLS
mmetsp:Transcript_74077/g.176424  ORF Transcript_74077/g.176424 Transcript_74077/m.176424 type:complete len:208 (+) Transcript_74077:218-841(+)